MINDLNLRKFHTNGIKDFYAGNLHAKEGYFSDTLCVDDVCVTRDQFAEASRKMQPPAASAQSRLPEFFHREVGGFSKALYEQPQLTGAQRLSINRQFRVNYGPRGQARGEAVEPPIPDAIAAARKSAARCQIRK